MLPIPIPDLTEEQWKQVVELVNKPETDEDRKRRSEALDLVKRFKS